MNKMGLLVIDVQNALMEEKPMKGEELISNIKKLVDKCRETRVEIIYVQHCDETGGQLEVNSFGWQIYSDIAPQKDEKVFEKYYNSAFKGTKLKDYLEEKGIEDIIVTGMQTEYCIDTSCKVAFEFGFNLIIPEKTNTTFDNGDIKAEDLYRHYNYNIFKNRFGIVESVDETINRITIYTNV